MVDAERTIVLPDHFVVHPYCSTGDPRETPFPLLFLPGSLPKNESRFMGAYTVNSCAISFMPAVASTSGRLHSEFIRLLFLQAHRETDRFFAASGVQLAQPNSGQFHFHRPVFSSELRATVGTTVVKSPSLSVNLNLDGSPITSKAHTHPSHSQTSRLLIMTE